MFRIFTIAAIAAAAMILAPAPAEAKHPHHGKGKFKASHFQPAPVRVMHGGPRGFGHLPGSGVHPAHRHFHSQPHIMATPGWIPLEQIHHHHHYHEHHHYHSHAPAHEHWVAPVQEHWVPQRRLGGFGIGITPYGVTLHIGR